MGFKLASFGKRFCTTTGYYYIKLRFTRDSWGKLAIPEGIGKYRTTNKGYIIFEAEYHWEDPRMVFLKVRLSSLKNTATE